MKDIMTRLSTLVGLLGCLLWTPGTPAAFGPPPVARVELSLLVLDDKPRNATVRQESTGDVVSETITIQAPERGAFVATRMECDSSGLGPCRPGWPMAVLTTVEGLKRFIAALPPGATVEWNVSCMGPFPRQHPLSASGAGAEIEKFAAQHRVTFVINKAG
ncbi:MAG TPA: hypothetical protein VHB47_00020 [Thermoanaerobaculia bacterium]|jgi:hypothetical protein|nr:hypothetical protein [Thermoanaerobaculia bacterium]